MYDKFADRVKEIEEPFIILIAGTADEKPKFLCACSKAAVAKGANAGKIVRAAAEITGGKGGGRPDSAMAGIVGAGGLGAIAINYGYYRKQSDIMYVMVILMAIIVLVFQELGMRISKHTDRRL